eukprot:2174105-Pyramimonas_sp.AAC.1
MLPVSPSPRRLIYAKICRAGFAYTGWQPQGFTNISSKVLGRRHDGKLGWVEACIEKTAGMLEVFHALYRHSLRNVAATGGDVDACAIYVVLEINQRRS